jgi:putative YphP/YqiW family bacilliredoxin
VLPDRLFTVFAGQDKEATAKAREYFAPYPPSSPSIALMKDGELVHMIERHQIENRSAEDIARDLSNAFEQYCK